MTLTLKRLRAVLSYDPETGTFIRLRTGQIAGGPYPKGGWRVKIDGRYYEAGRLAWLYFYGVHPRALVDHRDLDRSNNRIGNLREATFGQNRSNSRTNRNSQTGLKGVGACQRKFRAKLGNRHLGVFDTAEEAHAAYCKAAKEAFGEFFNPG